MIAVLFFLLFFSHRKAAASSSCLAAVAYSRCGTRETWCQLKATARRVIHHFTSPARGFRRNDSDVWLDSHTLSVTVLVHPDLTQVNRRLFSVRISKWKNPGTWFSPCSFAKFQILNFFFRHLHGDINLDEIKNALRLLSVNGETNLMNLIRL